MKERIFITGGAGYIGAMLSERFADREDVEEIIALDMTPMPSLLKGKKKISYIQGNTSDSGWVEAVAAKNPTIVIHTAWQIRELYGKKKLQWKWNVLGSQNVFNFAFSTPSVRKLIHFSTVASYGAYPENTLEHRFVEEEGFRKTDYLYAEEKRIVEENLSQLYQEKKSDNTLPQVFIVRPVAITGPRGRFMRIRFGLQSALSGQLKENFLHRIVSAMVSFVPITAKWCRQFIHEDDVNDIIELLAFKPLAGRYEIFNIAPPGDIVRGRDMAEAVGKEPISVHPCLIRLAFFLARHLSLGAIPTSAGGWKSYSYPIVVDGSKLTTLYGYNYIYQSKRAFGKTEGRYEPYLKESEKK